MAEKELTMEIIKRTQEILGKYVQKPPLTEKLLQKPPFRFLFDVFSVVIKDTGCFAGLYNAQELTYENIKDRDDKMRFLQKMIDVVKITTGAALTVRTSKIVSGQEPEKTNELLIKMGEIIAEKLDWQSAVQQVVNGGIKPTEKKSTSKTKEKLKDAEKPKDKDKQKSSKDAKVATTSTKKEKVKKDAQEKETKDKLKIRRSSKEIVEKKPNKSSEKTDKKKMLKSTKSVNQSTDLSSMQDKSSSKLEQVSEKTEESSAKARKNSLSKEEIVNESKTIKETDSRKSSSQSRSSGSGKRKIVQEEHNLEESLPNEVNNQQSDELQDINLQANVIEASQSSQETTKVEADVIPLPKHPNTPAKTVPEPILPKKPSEEQTVVKRESTFTRENSLETGRPRTSLRPPSARPASARPGAPRRRDKNVEIILQPNEPVIMSGINVRLDAFKDLDDDGEHLVVIEDPLNTDALIESKDQVGESNIELEQQGHLVQQILETQKELVQKTEENIKEKVNNRINSASVRQTSAQMNGLRDIIQTLTKSVNPLGKLMDFVPEDVDAMQLELSMWRDAYVQAAQELKREKSLTEETTEPLKHQLTQIEETIKEYREMVDNSRVKMQQNSQRILKLLSN